jgi:hypothetical protein
MGVAFSDYEFGTSFGGSGEESILLENTYLSLWAAVGPLGLAAFLAWFGGIVVAIGLDGHSLTTRWRRAAVMAAMLGLAVASFSSETMLRFTTGATFWIVVGVSVGMLPQKPSAPSIKPAAPQ